MDSAGRVRLGFMGAGNIGSVHMQSFAGLDGVVLAGVADAIPDLASARAGEFGIARVYDSADALLNDETLDAVVIGVPNRWHAPLAVQALKAGKHVLLEKPMALDATAAREIVEAAQASGKALLMGQQYRWKWSSQAVREQVEAGALGTIYTAKAGWMRRKGIPGWGTWFTRKADSGGGPLIDIGVHMLDLALFLMGNPKPVAVSGQTYAAFGPNRRGIGNWGTPDWDGVFDVEDLASAFIRMEDGSTLTLDVSWAVHGETDSAPFVHLMGSDGGASIRGESAAFYTEAFGRPVDIPLPVPVYDEGERVRMGRHFLACVRGDVAPMAPALAGLTNQLVLDGIYQSSQTGREVMLDELTEAYGTNPGRGGVVQ
ncbi:Gfo/Idh/MocA family protein [Alicyclobacillus sp. ALC3]|uniref:Gfo/Idh/MocA family protein n=1 Tax=Alicyclobacillus sp. ALC3 TaxID=2796143 RepID=UPI002378C2CB|nr:Gfo/Idh/MocA family oxidoreductase [Alicyclobacillus sp. ALC3]WDL97902.1 Gfo/Idh/MocA family oxidoreductase [Alicyclobacillus sp. ALC3]